MGLRKRLIVLFAVIAVVAIFAALFLTGAISTTGAMVAQSVPNIFGPSKESVAANVKTLYELSNPGVKAEVVTITEQNGMYKILLKLDNTTTITYNDFYATKDGELVTDSNNMISVQNYTSSITKYKDFVTCLYGKGVRIAGVGNQTSTLLQLSLLGRYSPELFVDCGANLNMCISANITQVPSVVIGQYVVPGVQNVDWFQRVTGCTIS